MVRRKLGLYLMGAAAVCMIAGCSANEEQRNCEIMGAGIGALAGAGAGLTGGLITGKKQLRLPVETQLTFTLRNEVRLPG